MIDEKYFKYNNLRGEYEVLYKNTFSNSPGKFLVTNDNLENLEEVITSGHKLFIEMWIFKTFGFKYFFILETNLKNISFCLTVFKTKPSDNDDNITSNKDINIIYKNNKFLIDGRGFIDKDGFIILKSLFGNINVYDYYQGKPYLGNGYIINGINTEELHKFFIYNINEDYELKHSKDYNIETLQRSMLIMDAVKVNDFSFFINHIHGSDKNYRYIDINNFDKDNKKTYYSFTNNEFTINLNNDDSYLQYIDKEKTLYAFIYNYDIPECTIIDGFGDKIVIQHAPKFKLIPVK